MFSVSRAMLFRWQQKYDQGGPVALETKKTPGPASRLSPTQLSKLYAIITGSDPRQLEFDFGLWTRKIIRDLIRREFGVKFSEVQVGRLLKKMGLSPQRPLYRAYQRDPERVAEWKKSIYPKIRKLRTPHMKRPCQAFAGRQVVDHLMSVFRGCFCARFTCPPGLPVPAGRVRAAAAGRSGPAGAGLGLSAFSCRGAVEAPASRPARRAVAAGDAQQP